jgi:hypothetical protein
LPQQSQTNHPHPPQDRDHRLWGVLTANGTSCAFKAPDATPLYYPAYKRASWEGAPPCRGGPKGAGASARKDTEGRLWGWQDDAPCAYKGPGNASEAAPAPRPKPPPEQAPTGGGASGCPGGAAPANCLARPCSFTSCLVGQTCVDDYCGGCTARCVGRGVLAGAVKPRSTWG